MLRGPLVVLCVSTKPLMHTRADAEDWWASRISEFRLSTQYRIKKRELRFRGLTVVASTNCLKRKERYDRYGHRKETIHEVIATGVG